MGLRITNWAMEIARDESLREPKDDHAEELVASAKLACAHYTLLDQSLGSVAQMRDALRLGSAIGIIVAGDRMIGHLKPHMSTPALARLEGAIEALT